MQNQYAHTHCNDKPHQSPFSIRDMLVYIYIWQFCVGVQCMHPHNIAISQFNDVNVLLLLLYQQTAIYVISISKRILKTPPIQSVREYRTEFRRSMPVYRSFTTFFFSFVLRVLLFNVGRKINGWFLACVEDNIPNKYIARVGAASFTTYRF